MTTVTRESITAMLNNPNPKYVEAVIGRALVALLNNQTADEQAMATTNEDNGIGFTGGDAYGGTLTAKYYIKHKSLLDWQVEKWLKVGANGFPRLAKYHAQLNAVAKPVPTKVITNKKSVADHRTKTDNSKLDDALQGMAEAMQNLATKELNN